MKTNIVIHGDCLDVLKGMAAASVDLVIGSPPYAGKGERYGEGDKWPLQDWIDWMFFVTREAVRVARNVVVWVVNGFVKDGIYNPACEGLVWACHRNGIRCERPVIWHKNAAPSQRPWFGNDWEFCLAFRPKQSTEYFDWEAIAEPPKFTAGGHFRQRNAKGKRTRGNDYPQSKLARPRDVIRATVGGGHMGSKLAHENEAPYPEKLIEPFILTCCPVGGVVLDPFAGSGTTLAVAERLGRKWIGIDARDSQVELSGRRIEEVKGALAC